jgi:uncharacterized protein (TIGR03437 family)
LLVTDTVTNGVVMGTAEVFANGNINRARALVGGIMRVLLGTILTVSCFAANIHLIRNAPALAFEARSGEYVSHDGEYLLSISSDTALLDLGSHAIRMSAVNANSTSTLQALDRMPGKANYLLGPDVRASYDLYGRVRWHRVYPGIDVVFRGNQEHLEYDFEIAAGSDPGKIRIAFDGADDIRIDSNGSLILRAGTVQICQPRPRANQVIAGKTQPVEVAYRIDGAKRVQFRIGAYDHRHSLVIDPEVVFENTFGGSASNSAAAIAVDAQGNIYAAGTTRSPDFPTVKALQSQNRGNGGGTAFITKWTPDGSQMLYSTYFGGSVEDQATSLVVDSSGSAYVAGFTTSPDFPVTANAFQKNHVGLSNAFVAKLAPSGSSLIYSTLLGGGSEQTVALAVDSGGSAIITGETRSDNFPVTPNAFQSALVGGCFTAAPGAQPDNGSAFISRLAPDGGSLVFSTLLGGKCGTIGHAVAVDSLGSIWVAGATGSADFPVTSGAIQTQFGGEYVDGFLANFSADGKLLYASYLGGNSYDSIDGIALDATGNIYIAGISEGFSQPASPGAFQSSITQQCTILGPGFASINRGAAFAAKLTPHATSVSGLTYLGGGGCVNRAVIAVDSSGTWIAGSLLASTSPFPTVSPFQIGIGNGFVSKLSPDFTQLLFSTFFNPPNALALDSVGLAYVAGATFDESAYIAKVNTTAPAVSLEQVLAAGKAPLTGNGLVLAPGEVLRLIGKNLGPAALTPGPISASGVVGTSVAGVQVHFGSTPAPLLSVSSTEIDCVVPFESAQSLTTLLQVENNGVSSNSVLIGIYDVAVQLLGVFNDDFTINSPANPAKPGSIISVYIAGAGQTVPPSLDGQINQAPFARAAVPIQVTYLIPPSGVGGTTSQDLAVTYAGAAPGTIAGILQINFIAPPRTSVVDLRAGNSTTEFTVTIQ